MQYSLISAFYWTNNWNKTSKKVIWCILNLRLTELLIHWVGSHCLKQNVSMENESHSRHTPAFSDVVFKRVSSKIHSWTICIKPVFTASSFSWQNEQTHTGVHTWTAGGWSFVLISTPTKSADGKLSVCQSHKLAHPSRHYLIIMISDKCLIVMTSQHQIQRFFLFYFLLHYNGAAHEKPTTKVQTAPGLQSNDQFYSWDESGGFHHGCPRVTRARQQVIFLAHAGR